MRGAMPKLKITINGESRDLVKRDAPPAGQTTGFTYGPSSDRLVEGETMALFSSGCWTVCNAEGQPLSEAALVESIRDGFGQSAAVAMDDLIQDHSAYFRDGKQADDLTMLLFHRVAHIM